MPTTLNAITSAGGGFAVTADSSGELAFQTAGTTRMTIDSSGNVIQASGNYFISNGSGFGWGDLTTYVGGTSVSDFINFNTNGSERMRIDASGNVGIGTSSPNTKLEVYGQRIRVNATPDPGIEFANTVAVKGYVFYDTTADVMTLRHASSTGINVNSSGNVGIGTSSPNQRLQIYSSGATGGAIQVTNASTGASSTDGVLIGYDGSNDVIINNQEATETKIFTSGTVRARFNAGGDFMVGMTAIAYSPSVGFGVSPTGAGGGTWISIGHPNGTGNGNAYIGFAYNGGAIGAVVQNTVSTVAYNTSSDYRLKDNITPMTGALAKVALLNPVNWTWKVDGTDGQGFIAHELQEVIPDAVTGEKDAVDDEGNPVYQGVDTSFLVATLTAAIQELKAELDTVKAELATLKGAV